MNKKHILILFTDQQRKDTIGAFGNEYIQTPNLDRLAEESVIFDNCITPSPVCVPARLCMFSGQYPNRTGCNNNNAENSYEGEGFYSALTEAGYESCCVGKMHHLKDPYGSMGFGKRYTQEELSAPEDDYTKFIQENYPWVFDYHGMRSEMYYVPQISQLPPKAHPTQWVGDHSVNYIKEYDSDKPMLLMASFIHPHPPFAPPAPWNKLYREDPEGPFCPGEKDLETFRNLIGERCSCSRLMISRQDLLRMKNYYYACVSFVDYQVGRIVQALKDKGMYEDTLVLFTSDHGDMMGDYEAIGKRSMVDSSCHIPFMIRCPGQKPGVRKDVCSLVDVAPTLLNYAGVFWKEDTYDGVNLFGGDKHDYVYSQHGCGEDGTYMVTDGSRKLVYKACEKRYYFFEQIPEVRDTYSPENADTLVMKELVDEYRSQDRNKAKGSKTYEKYTKTHPHYPGRMDHTMRHQEEKAAIPPGYRIDLD
ncbi:MAG: sulfatase-like hydrolase/transferase [Lachnospiraceae bacterium]|nr:sulfatase-like hydrolase/transferase [Lachnospiraceae bacterium]